MFCFFDSIVFSLKTISGIQTIITIKIAIIKVAMSIKKIPFKPMIESKKPANIGEIKAGAVSHIE